MFFEQQCNFNVFLLNVQYVTLCCSGSLTHNSNKSFTIYYINVTSENCWFYQLLTVTITSSPPADFNTDLLVVVVVVVVVVFHVPSLHVHSSQ